MQWTGKANSLLNIALECSVSIRILEWKSKGNPQKEDFDRLKSKNLSQVLGEKGDVLLYGGGKKGEAAAIFNDLAEAIALLSFLPGGIEIFGSHWESA